jgi:hypothetical protein
MKRHNLLIAAVTLTLAACSSSDEAPKQEVKNPTDVEGGGACKPNPALVAHRDSCDFASGAAVKDTIGDCVGKAIPIEHIVILMQENRTFDQYFGHLPGHGQDDVDVPDEGVTNVNPSGGDPIPWHHETKYCVEDTDHGWVASHTQWNNGKNDGFAISNTTANDPMGQRALGYYDQTDIPFYYDLISTFATGSSARSSARLIRTECTFTAARPTASSTPTLRISPPARTRRRARPTSFVRWKTKASRGKSTIRTFREAPSSSRS